MKSTQTIKRKAKPKSILSNQDTQTITVAKEIDAEIYVYLYGEEQKEDCKKTLSAVNSKKVVKKIRYPKKTTISKEIEVQTDEITEVVIIEPTIKITDEISVQTEGDLGLVEHTISQNLRKSGKSWKINKVLEENLKEKVEKTVKIKKECEDTKDEQSK